MAVLGPRKVLGGWVQTEKFWQLSPKVTWEMEDASEGSKLISQKNVN